MSHIKEKPGGLLAPLVFLWGEQPKEKALSAACGVK